MLGKLECQTISGVITAVELVGGDHLPVTRLSAGQETRLVCRRAAVGWNYVMPGPRDALKLRAFCLEQRAKKSLARVPGYRLPRLHRLANGFKSSGINKFSGTWRHLPRHEKYCVIEASRSLPSP
jgi:hypothetical protein